MQGSRKSFPRKWCFGGWKEPLERPLSLTATEYLQGSCQIVLFFYQPWKCPCSIKQLFHVYGQCMCGVYIEWVSGSSYQMPPSYFSIFLFGFLLSHQYLNDPCRLGNEWIWAFLSFFFPNFFFSFFFFPLNFFFSSPSGGKRDRVGGRGTVQII